MNNEIIPTGNSPRGLNFWQSRELNKIEQAALLEAGYDLARHNVEAVKKALAQQDALTAMRHAEERGSVAINAANRVIDLAIEAVGDSEIKSHHISKILSRTTTKLAEQV